MSKPIDKVTPFVYKGDVPSAGQAPSDTEATKFYTIGEVAKTLRVSPITIYRAIAQGRLRAFKVGGQGGYRITDAQLQTYLDKNLTKGSG